MPSNSYTLYRVRKKIDIFAPRNYSENWWLERFHILVIYNSQVTDNSCSLEKPCEIGKKRDDSKKGARDDIVLLPQPEAVYEILCIKLASEGWFELKQASEAFCCSSSCEISIDKSDYLKNTNPQQ